MKNIFIIGCLLVASICSAQNEVLKIASDTAAVFPSLQYFDDDVLDKYPQPFYFSQVGIAHPYSQLKPAPIQLFNPFMTGMFCKMESDIESLSKVAPRFRLGSLNYTEWMEGKQEIYMRYRQ